MKRLLTGVVLAAGMLLIIGPAIAAGLGDFLAVKKAMVEVEDDALEAEFAPVAASRGMAVAALSATAC